MKNKEHYIKVGAAVIGTFAVLYVAFFAYSQWKAKQAANATVDQTDASMSAAVAPADIQIGNLPSMSISTGNSEQDVALNTFAAYTPQSVQDWASFHSGAGMIPTSAWEYDPNYHVPYQVPNLPTGFQAPTVGNGTGTYVYNAGYDVTNKLQLEAM